VYNGTYNHSAIQQFSNSAIQQFSNSAIQQFSNSARTELFLDGFFFSFHTYNHLFLSVNYQASYYPLFTTLYRNALQAIWFDSS